jgi:LSD1 subclass zinc finger protein
MDLSHHQPGELQREVDQLELSLLRRGIDERAEHRERCGSCLRTPLVGERVYVSGPESIVCELCHFVGDEPTRLVHTPAFGHTIRIIDQRAA